MNEKARGEQEQLDCKVRALFSCLCLSRKIASTEKPKDRAIVVFTGLDNFISVVILRIRLLVSGFDNSLNLIRSSLASSYSDGILSPVLQ